MPEETKVQTWPAGWYEEAQETLETLLREADEAHKEADASTDWTSAPPFTVLWPEPCPPEYAHMEHLLPKRLPLRYRLEGAEWGDVESKAGPWEAEVILFTEGLAQDIYLRCQSSLEKFLSANRATDREGSKRTLFDIISPDSRASLLKAFTGEAIENFIYRLAEKMEIAFDELWAEAHFLAFLRMYLEVTGAAQDAGAKILRDPSEPLEEMKRLLTRAAARRRMLLREDVAACLGTSNFEELDEHYERLLPMWKDAKTIFKQNSKRPTWRDLIRAAHPDIEFDDDLIARLSGKLNDVPSEVQAKLSEKGVTPSHQVLPLNTPRGCVALNLINTA